MRRITLTILSAATVAACASSGQQAVRGDAASASSGQLAQIYYWRAKPGKFEEYSRYIVEVAEPIDREAQRHGAFVSVATWMTQDTTSAWTHMRVFVLRDSAQLRGLSAALDSAGMRLEPDSAKRRLRGVYSATLRDRVGSVIAGLLRSPGEPPRP